MYQEQNSVGYQRFGTLCMHAYLNFRTFSFHFEVKHNYIKLGSI